MSEDAWNVLIVDDDESMHQVTRLALSRMRWKEKKLSFTNAYSGKEAREIITAPDSPRFHVALIDVVMESEHRPVAWYTEAIADAGFVVERLREVRVPDHAASAPRNRRWQRLPLFLHVRALRP